MADQNAGKKLPDTEKGIQYPGANLKTALGLLEKVRGAVGFSAAQRDILVKAMGFATMSGHSGRMLGSLSHYGLMERAGKGAAKISALGKALLVPTSDDERARALADAAKRPNLFAALLEKFQGGAIPTLLPNMLIRDFGVHVNAAAGAAQTFRDTMEFAGLLRNGVLLAETEAVEPDDREILSSDGARAFDVARSVGPTTTQPVPPANTAAYSIPLNHSGRVATLFVPLPFTKSDLERIQAWATFTAGIVPDVETPDTSVN